LAIAFGLVVVFMVIEVTAGLVTGSLALLSDAGHMATDALGLGMALAAISVADRADGNGQRTYGLYRLEILAALANAVLLFGVAGYVLFEAVNRFADPPDVASGPMLVVAAGGLVVNVVGWKLLREGAGESINVEGAFLEVLADLIGSIGVIVAALLLRYAGWTYADPIFAAGIGLFILPRAWRLGRRAVRVLVQAAPKHFDLGRLRTSLASIPTVTDVHDLHVWTLTSEMDVATVHLVIRNGTDPHPVLDQARALLEHDYRISHATLQVEPDTHQGCAAVSW
jgi:cobalt-zinc-cadmium efflux system protein